MFVSLQFPFADVRPFINLITGRLKIPQWPVPTPRKDFVRRFGEVRKRLQGGVERWPGEDMYCRASHALRFSQELQLSPPLDAKWFCVFRRLFVDGEALARIEVGFRTSATTETFGGPSETLTVIDTVVDLPVVVRSQTSQSKSLPLAGAGAALASHFLYSTTARSQTTVENWWVTAGTPFVVVEGQGWEPPRFARRLALLPPDIDLRVHYFYYEKASVPVWFFESEGRAAKEAARRFRVCLIRLLSEHEVLGQVLRLVDAGRVTVQRGTTASDQLQHYFDRSLSLLARPSYYGFDGSLILRLVEHAHDAAAGGEAGSLLAKLSSVRRSILNQLNSSAYVHRVMAAGVLPERVFRQSPLDRLRELSNDYEEHARLFQHGRIALVDLNDDVQLAQAPEQEAAIYRKEHTSVMRTLLETGHNVPSVSIIVPVRGRRRSFLYAIKSLLEQSFVIHHPDKVECLVIQDGMEATRAEDPISRDLYRLLDGIRVSFRLFRLRREQPGRSTARNVGLYYARNRIVLFMDASMILDRHFLAEHMLRHQRLRFVGLLGFKENVAPDEDLLRQLAKGVRRPNYRKDWRWHHNLAQDEADFDYAGRRFSSGDVINYMELTNWLKGLPGDTAVGKRMLGTFFQTNISSAPLHVVKELGGFDPAFDPMWGFEDSLLGALLLATGVRLIPCPSSVAFKIEHPEDETKHFDTERHRQLFFETLTRTRMDEWRYELLEERMQRLLEVAELEELEK